MILNLHERWLLLIVGVRRAERRAVWDSFHRNARRSGDIDLLAEVGGHTLGKRSVRKELAPLFDRFMSPYDEPAHGVAFGNRRYRREVIIAAALHQAEVRPAAFRAGLAAGYKKLDQFERSAR